MPDDWKVGLIVPLSKNGDKMRCENYRGITLLKVSYKILSSIILKRLKEYSEEILGEYQCGFRPQRRTVRQILEKFYAHDIDLHLLFIDFKKAFDSINQKKKKKKKKKNLESLVSFWIPTKIERLVKMTLGAKAKVIVDGKISTPFGISIGVRQGDVLSAHCSASFFTKP